MSSSGPKKLLSLSAILPGLLVGLLTALIVFLFTRLTRKKEVSNPEKTIRETMTAGKLTPELISLFVAQSKHETDSFKSNLCINYFNLFGMTVPVHRKSLRNGEYYSTTEKQKFSTFSSYENSVKDMLLWIDAVNFPKSVVTLNQFVDAIGSKGYFTDGVENYKAGMLRFL